VAVVSADRKSTRLNSSHANISYAVFCLKKKKKRFALSCFHFYCVILFVDWFFFFFFNDTATTEIYTLSLHDALPILDDNVEGEPAFWASAAPSASG